MASYSIFSRPGTQADHQTCQSGSRAQSRFVEGSMNDRASNVPPRDFLGPDDVAAYERQFYLNNAPPRPSSGQSVKKAPGRFFAPLWDGVRERLHLTRSSSAGSIASNKTNGPVSQLEQQEKQQCQEHAEPTVPGNPVSYPTREEVMDSYKSLVDSGFFTAHAIQGSRHPRTAGAQPAPTAEVASHPPMSFSQHLAQQQNQCQPQPPHPQPHSSLAFSSIPYSATRTPPSGDPPLAPFTRPTTSSSAARPRSNNGRHQQQLQQQQYGARPDDESPQRGTKRAVADIAGGAADREWAETGARKLVKKLRKSASRISVDMALGATSRPQTRNSSSAVAAEGSGRREAAAAPGLPASANTLLLGRETPRHSVSTLRSFSSSWRPGTTSTGASTSGEKKSGGPPNRLSKAKKVLGGGGGGKRRRRSTSRSPGPPTQTPAPRRPAPAPPVPSASARSGQAGPPVPMPMAIDSPPPPTRPSFDGVVNGLTVPSFHYPQRTRVRTAVAAAVPPEPLSVVPDANRGIPSVPRIPIHLKHRRKGAAGIRDSGLGDAENCVAW